MDTITFKSWLALTNEGVFGFGKHRGKHHSEVDSGWLTWALQNVDNPGLISPEFRREIEEELAKRRTAKPAAKPAPPPPAPRREEPPAPPPERPPARALPSMPAAAGPTWVLAKITGNNALGFRMGQDVALAKRKDGSWEMISLDAEKRTGIVPGESVKGLVTSIKDEETGQPITSKNIEDLMAHIKPGAEPAPAPAEPTPAGPKANKHILSDEMLDSGTAPGEKSEQRQIDEKFKEIMEGGTQDHIMINALAGSGKTTMLKHLAWKYGNSGQKWLYLVFNTKNKVEAKEKFPQWVQVETTNGFLGRVIGSPENKGRIRQTSRTVEISKNHPGEKGMIEKARILATYSPQFNQLVQSLGIPNKDAAQMVVADSKIKKTLTSILNSMQYIFKEEVLTLTGLAKSFSLDPRNKAEVQPRLEKVMDKYDIDTSLSDVKERIDRYADSPSYYATITGHLRRILGYDFMKKNYKQEIMQATLWMLDETLPHASQHVLKKDDFEYNMGQFRDFNDDLWYASIHAEELHWPHYDVALADEVQDFNENQKIALKKLHDAGAKIVAVGDPNQAIYRFRGADGDAFNNLAEQLGGLSANKEGWQPFTLSKNFRSRKAILDYANENTHVNNLRQGKVFKDGGEGTVTHKDLKYEDAFGQLRKEKMEGNIKPTAFISRTNEPLVNAALKLLASAVPFVIVGKDVAKDLLQHIDKIMRMTGTGDFQPIADLRDKLQDHQQKEDDRFEDQGQPNSKRGMMQELRDTTQALVNCIGMFAPEMSDDYPGDEAAYGRGRKPPGKNIGQFKAWLKANLSGLDVAENERDLMEYRRKVEEQNPVILTTAHKSKGLEFSRVYILRDDQFPHPKAQRPEDLAQEANAKYVAYTRAMDELHILDLEGQPGYTKKG